jgi:antitoxin component YwqK of YwqJK toxin-antitoxin module
MNINYLYSKMNIIPLEVVSIIISYFHSPEDCIITETVSIHDENNVTSISTINPYTKILEGPYEVRKYKNTNSILRERGIYKNGLLHGKYESFCVGVGKEGFPKICSTYNMGVPNGECVLYDNNMIKRRSFYLNGKINGTVKNYLMGSIIHESNYFDGIREGIDNIYDSEGELLQQCTFKNGIKNGVQTTFYAAGGVKSQITYSSGLKDGIEVHYHTYNSDDNYNDGDILVDNRGPYKSITWASGVIHGRMVYYNNGALDKIITYNNGKIKKLDYYNSLII